MGDGIALLHVKTSGQLCNCGVVEGSRAGLFPQICLSTDYCTTETLSVYIKPTHLI